MLELLYAGALRVSELVTAKLEDLKLESGYMLVRGKGDKERIVPLGKPAQDALSEYLAQRTSRTGPGARRKDCTQSGFCRISPRPSRNSPLLFIARGGRKLTRQRIWQMVGAASLSSAGTHLPICCGIPAPRTWWKTVRTCARYRRSGPCGYFHDAGVHALALDRLRTVIRSIIRGRSESE